MNVKKYHISDTVIKLKECSNVWSPYSATDILEVLSSPEYQSYFKNKKLLDLGAGTGILGIYLTKKWNLKEVSFSDYNKESINLIKLNCELNQIKNVKDITYSDRYNSIRDTYDLIICNAPVQPWLFADPKTNYRPTAVSWNEAGKDGRLVLDSFIKETKYYLNKNGIAIITYSSRNDSEKTINRIRSTWGKKNYVDLAKFTYSIDYKYHKPYLNYWQNILRKEKYKPLYNYEDLDTLENLGFINKFDSDKALKKTKFYTFFITALFNH